MATATVIAVISAVISVGTAIYAANQNEDDQGGQAVTKQGSQNPRNKVYGKAIVGTTRVYSNVLDRDRSYRTDVLAVAGIGPLTFHNVWIEDKRMFENDKNILSNPTSSTNGTYDDSQMREAYQKSSDFKVQFRSGQEDQVAANLARSNSDGEWTHDHKGALVPHIVVYADADTNQEYVIFADRYDCKALVTGEDLYDPRTGLQDGNSNNVALALRDYLTSTYYGLSIPVDYIDDDSVMHAANMCELYGLEINSAIDGDAAFSDVLEDMLACMGGSLAISKGRIKVLFEDAEAVNLYDFDDTNMLTNSFKVSPASSGEYANVITTTFKSGINQGKKDDFVIPADVINDPRIIQDGYTKTRTINMPYTIDAREEDNGVVSGAVKFITSREYKRSLFQTTCSFDVDLLEYPELEIWSVVSVSNPIYEFDHKRFRVLSMSTSTDEGKLNIATVNFVEYDESMYANNIEGSVVSGTLPIRSDIISPPTSVTFSLESYVTGGYGTLNWSAGSYTGNTAYDIEFRLTNAANPLWTRKTSQHRGSKFQFYGLKAELYDFRIRTNDRVLGTSVWIEVNNIDITVPYTLPVVSGLSIDSTTNDFVISWDDMSDVIIDNGTNPDDPESDGTTSTVADVLSHYEVSIDVDGVTQYVLTTSELSIMYTYELNKNSPNGLNRGFVGRISLVDKSGNKSVLNSVATYNVQEDAPTGVTVTDVNGTSLFEWNPVTTRDFEGTEIHIGATEGFTPSPSTRIATLGSESFYIYSYVLPDVDDRFVRIAHFDTFGNDVLKYSPAQIMRYVSPVDGDFVDFRGELPIDFTAEVSEVLTQVQGLSDRGTIPQVFDQVFEGIIETKQEVVESIEKVEGVVRDTHILSGNLIDQQISLKHNEWAQFQQLLSSELQLANLLEENVDFTVAQETLERNVSEDRAEAIRTKTLAAAFNTELLQSISLLATTESVLSEIDLSKAEMTTNLNAALLLANEDLESSITSTQQAVTDESSTRAIAITNLNSSIESEALARNSDIENVQQAVDDEALKRSSAIDSVQQTVTDEASTRSASVGTLTSVIHDATLGKEEWAQFQQMLSGELQLSNMLETNIDFAIAQEQVSSEVNDVKAEAVRTKILAAAFNGDLIASVSLLASTESVIARLDQSESKLTQNFTSIVSDELLKRESSIENIQQTVTDEASTRATAITNLSSAIDGETLARSSAIDSVQQTVTDEASTRATAITNLSSAIDGETSARISAIDSVQQTVTDEASTRAAAITNLSSAISDETSARSSAIDSVQQTVTDESGTRASAIANLSSAITDGDSETLASSTEYTRTAVGYCMDSNGVITVESDAVVCVTEGGSWVEGPLADFVRKLQISNGSSTASLNDIRQAFENKDGQLIARGGMINDVNGRISGFLNSNDGNVSNFDIMSDVFRIGTVLADGVTFAPNLYLDQTNPDSPVMVFRGRLELGDGTSVQDIEDIRANDGTNGTNGTNGTDGSNGSTGAAGSDGTDGSNGSTGAAGSDGTDGSNGSNGTNGSDGTNGSNGSNGNRGAGRYVVGTSTGSWSNATANAATPNGYPVVDDVVTIYKNSNPQVQSTKSYNGSSWATFALHVHGDVLVDGTLRGDSLIAGTRIRSPKIEHVGSTHMRVSSAEGFGSNDQFIEWFGLKYLVNGEINYAALNESNAITYLKVNGSAYFRGSMIVGELTTSLSTSDTSPTANVEIGPFGSNGGSITVNCSVALNFLDPTVGRYTNARITYDPTCTLVLEEMVGASWSTLQSVNFVGSGYFEDNKREYQTLSEAFTFTINGGSTANRTLRIRMVNRDIKTTRKSGAYALSQRISILTSEG
jgi:hypothetical protein